MLRRNELIKKESTGGLNYENHTNHIRYPLFNSINPCV